MKFEDYIKHTDLSMWGGWMGGGWGGEGKSKACMHPI